MSAISDGVYSKRDLESILAECKNEEYVFCTEDKLQQSLLILNEVIKRIISDFTSNCISIC